MLLTGLYVTASRSLPVTSSTVLQDDSDGRRHTLVGERGSSGRFL